MKYDLKNIPCFGVAGNFTGHLEQAGEALSFKNVKSEEGKPKAIFPTYFPKRAEKIPSFLNVFPFSSEKIIFPKGEQKLQIESECAIVFDVEWEGDFIKNLKPVCFAASNDCSIRKANAKKISEKKNWGKCTKGFSENAIPISSFDSSSLINDYRIASFLLRGEKIFEYGENSLVKNYSCFYSDLVNWLCEKFNNQKDEGAMENVHEYLVSSGKAETIMVSVGATRYTEFGENNFLKVGDEAIVILYPESKYSAADIIGFIEKRDFSMPDISFLCEKIV